MVLELELQISGFVSTLLNDLLVNNLTVDIYDIPRPPRDRSRSRSLLIRRNTKQYTVSAIEELVSGQCHSKMFSLPKARVTRHSPSS